jgi:glyoxylase-like metal-dependent hydrolase (beta-lactamase superfamily II)
MEPIDFSRGAPVPANLDVAWIHGALGRDKRRQPPLQVHEHDPHTYLIRQSKTVSHEAPFLYLLFGNDRALLLDTGATADAARFPLRRTVDQLIERWLAAYPRPHYDLVVAHSHGHRDHVAADGQFADRPDTVIVGRAPADVIAHFRLEGREPAVYDLGDRHIEVLATPGHHPAAVAIYDPWTGWLLTGDTVYPGRLYASDFPRFLDSLDRLLRLAETRSVTHVMGCHVEMTRTPGRDYPIGSRYQPDEAPLPMTVDQLGAVHRAAHDVAGRPGAHVFDDFVIFHGRCTGAIVRQLGRTAIRGVRAALTVQRSTPA